MTAALPRFRGDLTVSRQATPDGAVFVVKDPRREKFYRFPEAAHFIAGQLDGATPLETVRQRTEEHFHTPLPPETFHAFVRHLETAGLLERDPANPGRAPAFRRPRRVAGNLLALRVRFFDPDRLFNRLAGPVRFFFTPYFLAVSAALIFAAAGVAVANWDDITQSLSRHYQLAYFPLILAVIFLVIGAHEFAHGLTCKHFGGEVHELGFLLMYFQPALYCNVSDAWLFPEKSKRLWVGFAGPYFELFLWALATLVWRLTDVEAGVNFVAFIVMTSSGFKTLFNFNPLIKLDGYYLLSDWLEIPNLRKRSFAIVGRGLKRLFGADLPAPPVVSRREHLICLAYGLVAVVPSFAILAFAFVKLGDYFIAQSQPLALALFTGLLGLKIRQRGYRLFGRASHVSAAPDDDEAPGPSAATAPAALPAAPPPKRKRSRRWLRWFAAVAAAGGVAAGAIHWRMELRIGGPFEVLPLHNADVRAQVEAIVGEVCVHEGDHVLAGAPVARLADRDLRAQLQDNAGGLAEAREKYRMLVAGPKPEEIDLAQTAVARAEAALKHARSQYARNQILSEKHLLTDKELEESQALVVMGESDLAEARSKLVLLRSGNRPEEIAAGKAEVERLQAQRSHLEEQFQLLQVVSPATGVVATPERELQAMRHQLVKKGDLIAKVYELRTITAEIAVSERDIADVQAGQKIVLKVRAYPEMTFFGTVTAISTTAQSAAGADSPGPALLTSAGSPRGATTPKMVLITTEIDNPALLLKPAMTGQAKIICGERRILDLLTRRIARIVRVEFWSWW